MYACSFLWCARGVLARGVRVTCARARGVWVWCDHVSVLVVCRRAVLVVCVWFDCGVRVLVVCTRGVLVVCVCVCVCVVCSWCVFVPVLCSVCLMLVFKISSYLFRF